MRALVVVACVLAAAACGASSDDVPSPAATQTGQTGGALERALTDGANNARVAINFARTLAVTEGGALHAVWVEGGLADGEIWYGRSPDRGVTWEQPLRLGRAVLPPEGIVAVAAAGQVVYAAWHDFTDRPHIVLRRSLDAGATWDPARVVVDGPAAAFPSLAARGESVQLVFANTPPAERLQEIYASRSADRGETWSAPERLSTIPYASFVPHAGIGEEGGFAVWIDYQDGNEEVYLRRWVADAGWAPAQRLTDDPADSWAAQLAVDGAVVHVTWFDRRASPIRGEAIEERLNDALELIAIEAVPERSAATYYLQPLMARLVEKRQAVAAAAPAWVRGGGDPTRLEAILQHTEQLQREWAEAWEIYYRRSLDGGRTFAPEQRLTATAGASQRPSIAVEGDAVYVAWFDSRATAPEIYLRSSGDGGATWGAELRVTDAPGPSRRPTIALDADFVHLIWSDARSGNAEVYYGRLPRSNSATKT